MTDLRYLSKVSEIPLGTAREFVIDENIWAVYHLEEGFFAVDGMCPHQGGPLVKGHVRGKIVTCPWHGWQYDVTTGNHCLNDQIRLSSAKVVIQNEELFLEL